MSKESNYRKIVAGFALAMLAIRLYYQRKALAEGGPNSSRRASRCSWRAPRR